MSNQIVPIIVPTGELSDSLVVGMFRHYQSTRNDFVGDLLARHAPKSTNLYSQLIASPRIVALEQPRLERAYMREMLGFTMGLMRALMDESIGISTTWGRSQPHLSESVNVYMTKCSEHWRPDGTGSIAQREFYDELMDPFLLNLSNHWDRQIRKHPNLMWFGTFLNGGDLVIEAGDDYRAMDPNNDPKDGRGMFLDDSYGDAIAACDRRFVDLRRNQAHVGEMRIGRDPFEFLYERPGRNPMLPIGGKLKPLEGPVPSSMADAFQKIWSHSKYGTPMDDGVVVIRVAKDDIIDDSPKIDPNKSKIEDVPMTHAELIARDPRMTAYVSNFLVASQRKNIQLIQGTNLCPEYTDKQTTPK